MSFKVPEGYEEFVSSPDDLLKQFQIIDSKDHVCCQLYLDDDYNFDNIMKLRDQLAIDINLITTGYIWQSERFTLGIVISSNDDIPVFLQGLNYFADNIEDEWFIVYILFCLSKKYSFLSICVTDVDGQFLLSEAADYIPTWLGPENSNNRVWIRDGNLHIISLEESGKSRNGGIKLKSSLENLRKNPKDYVVNSTIFDCIKQRIDIYPPRALANMHRAACTVPKKVALALLSHPQLISSAVEILCNYNKDDRKAMSTMKRFGCADFVTIPVQFSRILYAQMTFQTFTPPAVFHPIFQELSEHNSKKSPKIVVILQKALDLGCRISCGLEAAYQRSSKGFDDYSRFNVPKNISNIPTKLPQRQQELQPHLLQQITNTLHLQEKEQNKDEILTMLENGIISFGDIPDIDGTYGLLQDQMDDEQTILRHPPPSRIIPSYIPIVQRVDALPSSTNNSLLLANNEIKNYQNVCHNESEYGDNDNWLYLSPEEFEKEMNDRVAFFTSSSSNSNNSNSNSNSTTPPSPDSNNNNNNKKNHNENSKNIQNTATVNIATDTTPLTTAITPSSDIPTTVNNPIITTSDTSIDPMQDIVNSFKLFLDPSHLTLDVDNTDDVTVNTDSRNNNNVADTTTTTNTNKDFSIDFDKLLNIFDSINNNNKHSTTPTTTNNNNNQPVDSKSLPTSSITSTIHDTNVEGSEEEFNQLSHFFSKEDLNFDSHSSSSSEDSDDETENNNNNNNNNKYRYTVNSLPITTTTTTSTLFSPNDINSGAISADTNKELEWEALQTSVSGIGEVTLSLQDMILDPTSTTTSTTSGDKKYGTIMETNSYQKNEWIGSQDDSDDEDNDVDLVDDEEQEEEGGGEEEEEEEEEGNGHELSEEFMEQYLQAMDSELRSFRAIQETYTNSNGNKSYDIKSKRKAVISKTSTAASTTTSNSNTLEEPEDDDSEGEAAMDGEDEVDLNLLTHLLESHASQEGPLGPASSLLTLLGIKLPVLP